MAFEHYIVQDGVRLRRGYTTGTCATLATKAACMALISGQMPETVSVSTPRGLDVTADILDGQISQATASCAVVKDGGDDIDATTGAYIYATVSFAETTTIDGGTGVGIVTKAGLDQPVGNAAINSTPRRQILAVLQEVAPDRHFAVTISVPQGQEIAKKTFNPQLGIVGGISILGTSGIVEPRSLKALLDSLAVEIRVLGASGAKTAIITPGNYGEHFLESYPNLAHLPQIKCANFIGDTLDLARESGLESVLLVGHLGKMAKIAGGIMNTHSKVADCRTELFAAHGALAGASQTLVAQLMDAATSDRCLELLDTENLREQVLKTLTGKAQQHLTRRAGDMKIGLITFTNQQGLLTVSQEAQQFIESL